MGITTRFIVFQAAIVVPFLLGIFLKSLFPIPDLPALTKRLIRINLIVIEPVIVLWSTWGLSLNRELILLPLFGLFIVLVGMAWGWFFRPLLGLSGKRGATFLIHSTLANHGFTMGAFLCFLMLGEKGLGLAFLFLAYFMPFTFLVVFPYARRQSAGHRFNLASTRDFLWNLENMPLVALALSLGFLAIDWERPPWAFPVDSFIILSMALYYFTLGGNFTLPSFFRSGKENVALAAIKFILVPALVLAVLNLLEIDPMIESVILIESCMPAAVYSVVSSVLFDLDAGFASNLFVWNSLLFLAGILPLLLYLRGFFLALPG